MKYMTVGLKREVSLALLPIDDFTNRIITGSLLRVYIKGENKSSIRKPDGYHIFCNLPGSEVEVCLEGPIYQKQTLRLEIEQGRAKVYQVRMLPGIGYPLPEGAAVLSGTLPKNYIFRVFFCDKRREAKLFCDYDPLVQKETLSIFQSDEMSLIGKVLCICQKEAEMEFFRVKDQKENVCVLEEPLSKTYERINAVIYPAYETAAGEDGSFYLLMGSLAENENCIGILMKEGRIEKTCKLVIRKGKENRITEEIWKGDD